MGRQIGYARVLTDDLHGKAQKAALHAVPCDLIFLEQEFGANRERPELARALKELRVGDTLVAARLERLGRSRIHLLQIMKIWRVGGSPSAPWPRGSICEPTKAS